MYLHGDYVGVQYNGGFPRYNYIAIPLLLPLGNPIKPHKKLSLQPIFPPKSYDNFPPLIGWMLRGFRCVHIFLLDSATLIAVTVQNMNVS